MNATLEQRLVAEMTDGHERQRKSLRIVLRKIMLTQADEEERRAAIEAANEVTALEAEIAWRSEALQLHRSTTARLGEFGERQACRLQELQGRMEAEVQKIPSTEHTELACNQTDTRSAHQTDHNSKTRQQPTKYGSQLAGGSACLIMYGSQTIGGI